MNAKKHNFPSKKWKLLLKLGKNHALSKSEEEVMMIRNHHDFNLFLFEEMGHGNWLFNNEWETFFPTDEEKILSLKGVVLLEKIAEDHDGARSSLSTTVTAVIFNKIQKLGLDTPDLVNFILFNKSSNPYAIFGNTSYSDVRDYKQYVKCFYEKNVRFEEHKKKEQEEQERKNKLEIERRNNHKKRLEISKKENIKKYESMEKYFSDTTNNLMQDIIDQKLPFHIFLIPSGKLQSLENQILTFDIKLIHRLLKILPKKSPEHIRKFRGKINRIATSRAYEL